MRIGLLTEGGYPYVSGDARLWCDRLVRGLRQHEFDIYALSRSERQENEGWIELPPHVSRVRTAPLWTAADDGVVHGRAARKRFAEAYGELATLICSPVPSLVPEDGSGPEADRFGSALHALAELARDEGGLVAALRSETAVRALERACRAPGAGRAAHEARVADLLAVAAHLERTLRPLSLDWYGVDGLGSVDLCHTTAGGAAALPGLLAHHFSGVPLVVTEYGVQLRTRYLTASGGAPVRALLAAFHGRLTAEVYRRAACITPGNAHARRWQERCGADSAKVRTVYPGMNATRFAAVGESGERAAPHTLVWVGRIEPAKDLVTLLHAFAAVHRDEPRARLRIVGVPAEGGEGAAYLGHCRQLAARLFPRRDGAPVAGGADAVTGVDGASGAGGASSEGGAGGAGPVSFEVIGPDGTPDLTEVYAGGAVVVLSSFVEGFPVSLVEAMFCGRPTVSTDVGAVVEVIGGTGLVVPPRNPPALAEACLTLLRDPGRRLRLGAAARARALELFTVEQNIAAFRGIYLETVSRAAVRKVVVDERGAPLPFGAPAEAHIPGHWTTAARPADTGLPEWEVGAPVRATTRSAGRSAPAPTRATATAPAPARSTAPGRAAQPKDAAGRGRGTTPAWAARTEPAPGTAACATATEGSGATVSEAAR